jgi:hypothetical protein
MRNMNVWLAAFALSAASAIGAAERPYPTKPFRAYEVGEGGEAIRRADGVGGA